VIPFNKPYLHGKELSYISESVSSGKISGDGIFSKRCHQFFEERYRFQKVLLTTSCTDALEMASILLDIQPGDEVILPSFTFVSTANPFYMRGATLVFSDSTPDHPNIDPDHVRALITPRTRAIVVVHYAGAACDMDALTELASRHNIHIIEDAAQAIDAEYKGQPLGGIGTFGTFSFHETKNIISGEGGLLAINNREFIPRAEIIREKGTNRAAFFRGEVDKYDWVDIGSSFLPPDTVAAYLFAQLELLEKIQLRRIHIWNLYHSLLEPLAVAGHIQLQTHPEWSTNNAHLFYILCSDIDQRTELIGHLKKNGIHAVFHYLPLHSSTFFRDKYNGEPLINCDKFSNSLLRLPLFYELDDEQIHYIASTIYHFFGQEIGRTLGN